MLLESRRTWRAGRLVRVVALAVGIGAAGCEGSFVAPASEVTEDVGEVGYEYSCHVDKIREGSGIVCVTDDPIPAILVAWTISVVSSAVVAIVMSEIGSNPRWLRYARESCHYTAVREGWDNFAVELIYDSETGDIVEWNCAEVEY